MIDRITKKIISAAKKDQNDTPEIPSNWNAAKKTGDTVSPTHQRQSREAWNKYAVSFNVLPLSEPCNPTPVSQDR